MRKTAAVLSFVHSLAVLLINTGPQPVTKVMQQFDS